ncbi:type VI secretion system tip protein VgrG [Labilibacter sediminis]|nr:type VI secretion system tip protein VgrG [Labilibacter sediminis]
MALTSSVRIEIDNQEINDFLDFSIDQEMNEIQSCWVRCRMDTFEEDDDFVMNKSKKLIGSTIIITAEALNPEGKNFYELFYKGIIQSIRAVKTDIANEDLIIITGFSPDALLMDHPGCRTFEEKSLRQIVDDILQPYPRDILKTNINPVYKEVIPYCVQYKENTLAFLHRLAKRYGEWMYYNGKELIFGQANGKTEELILGKDLDTFDYSINLKAPGVKYVSYDYMSAKSIETKTEKTSGKNQQNEPGKYTFDQSEKHFSYQTIFDYQHLNVNANNYTKAQKDTIELSASARALDMSAISGNSENMNLTPGSKISITALKTESNGDVSYGDYIITSVQHKCDNLLNYKNKFIAIPAEAKIPPYTNPNSYPVCETQSAVVKDNRDPEKLGRIQVQFFWQGNGNATPWIRLVTPYSGAERGFYFIPEIDDEVLIGFEGGDAERPYVIGSLYHGKNKPASQFPDQNNSFKGIVTQSNLKIEFDDDKKSTTIETPSGNKIVLNDDAKSILLHDENNNKVELSSNGITLNSGKDIKISSQANVSIEGTGGVTIKSSGTSELKGTNVNLNADASLTAKGNATAELSASGQTTVKGAMVMIN